MARTLSVWWEQAIVGTLRVNQHGEMRFTYSPEWLDDSSRPAISYSLPERPEPFTQPTTHILKPPIARFPSTTENEALVMTLAAAIGLPVAPAAARAVAGRPYLLVTRYDRYVDESGLAHRLHQEDFCQALGIPPERKYASEDGPTFKTSFDLLRKATTTPAVAVLALLDAAIFNLIVGNADAHGKNFSLLYQDGTVTLGPFYDLLSTVAYPDLSPKLAMKIDKRATLEEIRPATWPAFAEDTGLAAPFVRRRVTELADAVAAQASLIPRAQHSPVWMPPR